MQYVASQITTRECETLTRLQTRLKIIVVVPNCRNASWLISCHSYRQTLLMSGLHEWSASNSELRWAHSFSPSVWKETQSTIGRTCQNSCELLMTEILSLDRSGSIFSDSLFRRVSIINKARPIQARRGKITKVLRLDNGRQLKQRPRHRVRHTVWFGLLLSISMQSDSKSKRLTCGESVVSTKDD